jgi:hypothetical protein
MTDNIHEAIVRAALERAAKTADDYWGSGFAEILDLVATDIRNLASDPTEVAAIIKNAGEDRG